MSAVETKTGDKKEVIKVIEDMRIEMYSLANLHGFTHPAVLAISTIIDEKVNEYLRIK